MSLNTFSAYGDEFPVDLSSQGIRDTAERIAIKKDLQFEDVLIVLKDEQTKAATRCNEEKRRKFGKNHSFVE